MAGRNIWVLKKKKKKQQKKNQQTQEVTKLSPIFKSEH